jgi:hypothetical protein
VSIKEHQVSDLATDLAARFDKEGHSFVIRLWRESGDPANPKGEWRGWVTHVQSDKRYYVRSSAEIEHVISTYMDNRFAEKNVFEPILPEDDN